MDKDKIRDDSSIDEKLQERIQQLKQKQEENDEQIQHLQEEKLEQTTRGFVIEGEEQEPIERDEDEQVENVSGPDLAERLGPSYPFEIAINLGGEALDEVVFDQDRITIGRDTQCDVHIDNLGASRVHAQIERFGRFFLLRDLESKTGTFVRGKKIEEYSLNTGDEIFLAKHSLVFKKLTSMHWHNRDSGKKGKGKTGREHMMQTMAVDFRNMAQKQGPSPAQLQFVDMNRRLPITKNILFFGKSSGCDYMVNGFLVSEKHAILVNERKGYVLHHLGFWKPPRVNEKPINVAALKEGDLVQIADLRFIFRAPEES